MTGSFTSALEIRSGGRQFLLALRTTIPDFWSLTKPEVNFLIVIATFTGFYLGYPGALHSFPLGRLLNTLFGTLLIASGTGALNQYLEHDFDAQMRRTRGRPIVAGRIRPAMAAWFGAMLSFIGCVYLFVAVNPLASVLALFTLTTYLLVYTPLKRKTQLCTLAGAFPGAMPPMIGWAAAAGSIGSVKAWILYAVLFLWQFPHFMAIGWMYREDYARAGYMIFPAENEDRFLLWMTAVPALALFVASLGAVAAAGGGPLQFGATVVMGSSFLYYASRLTLIRSSIAARKLLKATIICLPLQFVILIFQKS
jgi:protoheme IX farnesyltransferase